ncbi:hypothetical protein CKAN_02669600 [Cinnamomum micranthum f. kanehirae]|uniref:Uncharacterized protein n=1 Tax=Cinnamomum micranthum f. kanehirae TaxID=337451 RepID=A0A3S3R9C7_9MAGN|nr:hypothetical protein CKAN_02669600 [Cinnamomum micranthum f. kanehirae]
MKKVVLTVALALACLCSTHNPGQPCIMCLKSYLRPKNLLSSFIRCLPCPCYRPRLCAQAVSRARFGAQKPKCFSHSGMEAIIIDAVIEISHTIQEKRSSSGFLIAGVHGPGPTGPRISISNNE